jgi:hypothetical protein
MPTRRWPFSWLTGWSALKRPDRCSKLASRSGSETGGFGRSRLWTSGFGFTGLCKRSPVTSSPPDALAAWVSPLKKAPRLGQRRLNIRRRRSRPAERPRRLGLAPSSLRTSQRPPSHPEHPSTPSPVSDTARTPPSRRHAPPRGHQSQPRRDRAASSSRAQQRAHPDRGPDLHHRTVRHRQISGHGRAIHPSCAVRLAAMTSPGWYGF